MSAPEYQDVTGDVKKVDGASTAHGASNARHTASTKYRLEPNNDPALDPAHEHHHTHLHHSERAVAGREDDMMYSKETTDEPSTIPHQDALDHALNRRHHLPDQKAGVNVTDTEKGGLSPIQSEEDPQSHTFARFYSRYRIFFHLFVWLLFTGYEILPPHSIDYCPSLSSQFPSILLSIFSFSKCNPQLEVQWYGAYAGLADKMFTDGGLPVSSYTVTISDG